MELKDKGNFSPAVLPDKILTHNYVSTASDEITELVQSPTRARRALIEACEQGDVNKVNLLMGTGIIDVKSREAESALSLMCGENEVENVRKLLESGVRVSQAFLGERNAWVKAIENDQTEIIKLLIEFDVDIDQMIGAGHTALFELLRRRKYDLVSLLMQAGADVNTCHGVTLGFMPILHYATDNTVPLFVLRDLIDLGADVNLCADTESVYRPLMHACWYGNIDAVSLLLARGAHIEGKRGELVHGESPQWIDQENSPTSLRRISFTPLMVAVERNHCNIVELLLDSGANVDQMGSLFFMPPQIPGSPEPSHKRIDCTPLMLAAQSGRLEATRILLKRGAQINKVTNSSKICQSWTPLMFSMFNQRVENHDVTKHLLRYGCDANVPKGGNGDAWQWTPISGVEVAAACGMLWEIQALAIAGAHLGKVATCLLEDITQNEEVKHVIRALREANSKPHPLMELCRFAIRNLFYVNIEEKIAQLSYPNFLKGYLNLPELDRFS